MSTQFRAGIRAARALLSLLEENSAEELEAAESILGGDKELTTILQLLRKFKEHEEQPLSVERLIEIVRRELVDRHLSLNDMEYVITSTVGIPMGTLPGTVVEETLDRTLKFIETLDLPRIQVDLLTSLLIAGFQRAGPEHEAKIDRLLCNLAAQSLSENLAMFPTLHSLAQLRIHWADNPLNYQPQESRRHLADRLLVDAQRSHPENFREITRDMLRQGMSGPADGAIAAVRRMKPKKARGE